MMKHQTDVIYQDRTTKVIAVFLVNVDVFKPAALGVYYACIKPVSVVICQRGTSIAIDMQAQHISPGHLCQLAPELMQHL